MADTKISALPAVTTPASTDEFAVAQGGTSKKETRAQLHALESGEHFVLPQVGEPLTPTLAFGDGDTGFYEGGDDDLRIAMQTVWKWRFQSNVFEGAFGGAPRILNETATDTNPTFCPHRSSSTTGLGASASGVVSIIAGGVEAQRISQASSAILHAYQADVGLTAHTDSVQGAGVILSSYNIYSTVGTAGDAATLPAVAIVGTKVYVKNDAAVNSMDIFPASGDDAGAGTDAAVAVAAGDFAIFLCTVANATWTKIMGGTA